MRISLLALCLLLTTFGTANAQWIYDGVPVSTTVGHQSAPVCISDGSGGMILTWIDQRSGQPDIWAQRINASGTPVWAIDGVVVCNAAAGQYDPKIVSDGAGGAIIAWYDQRAGATYDIYAQRLNSSGVPQWTANGVALCTAINHQYGIDIVTDGSAGAIVAWQDFRSGATADLYARRINSAGAPQWTADGVAICTASGQQEAPAMATDGLGGAILTWSDWRTGTTDVYAQRILSAGTVQWTANGLPVCVATQAQNSPQIASDGANGAVVVWFDSRIGNNDIYAQRVNSLGAAQWTTDGTAVCTDPASQTGPQVCWDNSLGAFFSWTDARPGGVLDVYAQRFNAAGAPQWLGNGIPVCNATGDQQLSRIISGGPGAGPIVSWIDGRSGPMPDVYAQRFDAGGLARWTANGMPVCQADNLKQQLVMVTDGAGGALLAWADNRPNTFYDVYGQRVEGQYGYWGKPEPVVSSVTDVPGDQGGKVKVKWTASQRDATVPRTITYYTIWRSTDLSLVTESSLLVRDLKDVKADAKGPIYFASTETGDVAATYWEHVGTQSAHGFPSYSFTASTLADSIASNSSDESFMIAAHIASDAYVAFQSNTVTGHSVDNLAPPAPLFLTANRVGADVHLEWNRVRIPDLDNYQVYRATSSGVTPIPPNFLTNDDDTLMVDASAPGTALYYIVTAKDVHGNQGVASNEASVSPTTGAGNTPPITALTVLQNHPNPFSGETALQVGLPGAADVSVEIYDVAGRRVREQSFARQAKGWSTLRLDSRDRNGALLPSGVYFYRVRAGTETVTNKMVIAR